MKETNEKNEKISNKTKQVKTKLEKTNAKKTFFNFAKKEKNVAEKPAKNISQDTSSDDLNSLLKINPKAHISEYYDLPYRYNQTIIKILAQTPHAIFIYWDISDSDRSEMVKKYGDNFFNETKPILLVHNKTQNYSFEVEIDDFANSWYLRTPTSNCVFNIELGRKPISNTNVNFENNDNVLHITSSNTIVSPNDHILNGNNIVYFKNIKTNETTEKCVSDLKPIYNIYDLYEDDYINNPSSNFKI